MTFSRDSSFSRTGWTTANLPSSGYLDSTSPRSAGFISPPASHLPPSFFSSSLSFPFFPSSVSLMYHPPLYLLLLPLPPSLPSSLPPSLSLFLPPSPSSSLPLSIPPSCRPFSQVQCRTMLESTPFLLTSWCLNLRSLPGTTVTLPLKMVYSLKGCSWMGPGGIERGI